MPESDQALCARLAEWRGWEPVRLCKDEEHDPVCSAVHGYPNDCPHTSEGGILEDCPNTLLTIPPSYDTDPVVALELLEWLAKRGWSYICGWDQADGDQRFCRLWKHTDAPDRKGVRRIVITKHAVTEFKAIARAAEAVRESEEGE